MLNTNDSKISHNPKTQGNHNLMDKADTQTNNYNMGPVKSWIYPGGLGREDFLEEVMHVMILKRWVVRLWQGKEGFRQWAWHEQKGRGGKQHGVSQLGRPGHGEPYVKECESYHVDDAIGAHIEEPLKGVRCRKDRIVSVCLNTSAAKRWIWKGSVLDAERLSYGPLPVDRVEDAKGVD